MSVLTALVESVGPLRGRIGFGKIRQYVNSCSDNRHGDREQNDNWAEACGH